MPGSVLRVGLRETFGVPWSNSWATCCLGILPGGDWNSSRRRLRYRLRIIGSSSNKESVWCHGWIQTTKKKEVQIDSVAANLGQKGKPLLVEIVLMVK